MATKGPVLHRISPEEKQNLIDGKAKIVADGTASDQGDADQMISLFISDQSAAKDYKNCPLIFTIEFTEGLRVAKSINFQCMSDGKKVEIDRQTLMNGGFKRGQTFAYSLHVTKSEVQADIMGENIRPVDRMMGFEDAQYLTLTGNGLDKAQVRIVPDCQ